MKNFCMMPWFAKFDTHDPCCHLLRGFDLAQVQKDILNDVRHSHCLSCWKQEDIGEQSERQIYNKIAEKFAPLDFYKAIAQKGQSRPIVFQVQRTNTCNGACIMCNEHRSSKWASLNKNNKKQVVNKNFDDYVDYKIAKHINILGGEPFLDNSVEIVLDKLSMQDNHKCVVSLVTNGSIRPKKTLFDLMKKHDINITVSVDGIGNVFDYQRWPLKWSQVEKNLHWFQQNFDTNISYCVTNINIFEHQKTIQYFNQHKLPFKIHRVMYPKFYSPDFLPIAIKKNAVESKICTWNDFNKEDFTKDFKLTIQNIKHQDQIKKIKMSEFIPEIYKIFREYF